MSIKAVSWAFEQKLSDPLAKLVLLAVADHHNDSTGISFPSIDRLMGFTEASRSTIIRKLKKLEAEGFMTRQKRYNNTDVYTLNTKWSISGCHTDTSEGDDKGTEKCQSDCFGVSQRHTNRKEPLPIYNKKKTKGKQKVSEWTPSDDDKAYAVDLGLDADDVLESIRLWDEQNGHKANYASVSAFWKTWCRREAKSFSGASKAKKGGNTGKGAVKTLSEAQKTFIESLLPKYKRAYPQDDMGMVRDALTKMMEQRLDIVGWYKLGYGIKHYTEF